MHVVASVCTGGISLIVAPWKEGLSIFVDINNRTRKRRGNVSRRPQSRKDVGISRTMLGQRGREEGHARVRRIPDASA